MKNEDRIDVWKCARCGRIKEVPSLPHQSPQCCGTGMWFQGFKDEEVQTSK